MERRLIGSGTAYEASVGYSRAVVAGEHVFTAGCAPAMADGGDPPTDTYGQTKRCIERIAEALSEAGGSLRDVVRTTVYLTPEADFDEFGRAHGEAFSAIRPANTTVIIAGLVDPRWHLEIEADAVLSPATG